MNLQDQDNSVHDEQFGEAKNQTENTESGENQIASDETADAAETPAKPVKKKPAPKKAKTKSSGKSVKKQEPAEKEAEDSGDSNEVSADMDEQMGEEPVAEKSSVREEVSKQEPQPEIINYSLLSQEDLVKILEEILSSKPVQEIRRDVESIKVNFYKRHRAANDSKRKEFVDSGGLAENFEVPSDPLEEKISELLRKYRDLRMEYNRSLDDAKLENLAMRQEIIEEIKELVNSEESINKTFQEFRELQNRWREIGAIPQQNVNDIWDTYHHHVEKFYDYIKINKELRDLDLKKNLESKIELCEKAEKLLLEPNVVNAFASLQKYHELWREIGPIPKDKQTEIWERFKEATSKINKKHQQFYHDLKESQKKNLESKVLLCEKAEEIAASSIESHKDWVRRTNEMLEIQKVWKTIGFAPKKENNKIYTRFRHACDTFFEKKRGFYAQNLAEQAQNLQRKLELCIQAEAMQDSTDWKKTTDDYIHLQRKWKEIGPAPRKNSEQVWKRFRNACDKFFSRKTEFYSTIDNTFEKNLEEKLALLKEIEAFQKTDDGNADLKRLQEYQRKWTDIGFVPYEKKDELQQQYREAINKKFESLDVDESKKSMIKFRHRIEAILQKPNSGSKIRFEREKYMVKLQQLKSDIGVWENNIGFFANTSNAESMLKDFQVKIEDAKQSIHILEEKITFIDELNID
ncbi:MAG: DUF349 domain-containing protein [Bacteroidales bacterium]|nr:DUF349 domain-containing protein [Bacteroidales bacterium]MCB9013984.1 DUF349 domain-containing protein [Bacteroidales bacterium]